MSKPKPVGPLLVCTECGHQSLRLPEPHPCKTGWADDKSLSFRPATPEEIAATHKPVVFDGDKAIVVDGQAELVSPDELREREIAEGITEAFADAKKTVDTAMRKVVVCGLLLMEQKGRLKHGEFGPWLAKRCPDVPWRTAQQWMQVTEVVCKNLQIRNDCVFGNLPLHQVLQLPAPVLPKEAQKVQEQVFEFVDGKSQKQLLFDFRDLEPKVKGGDREWEAWLKKTHPKLVVDGKVPGRKQVSKDIWAEWEKFQQDQEKKNLTPELRRKIAKEDCAFLEEAIYKRGVRNPNLKLLPPAELAGLLNAVNQFKDKLEKIKAK